MKQKTLYFILTAMALLSLLVACGSSESKSRTKADSENEIVSDLHEEPKSTDDEIEGDWNSIANENSSPSPSTSKPSNNSPFFKPDTEQSTPENDEDEQPTTPSTTPSQPEEPAVPSAPTTPTTPSTPTKPPTPSTPSAPTEPTTPNTPSTPATPSTPSTPTTPTPEPEPSGVLIGANIYGCGEEHSKVANGITFHWYDRYERRYSATSEAFATLDISSFDVEYVVFTPSPSWYNNDWDVTYNVTVSRSTCFYWKTYDAEGYFIEEVISDFFSTSGEYLGGFIEGKNRGISRIRGRSVEENVKYMEFYPTL